MCENCGGSGGVHPDATCVDCNATGATKVLSEDWLEASQEIIALDPTFWSSLGKALGWVETEVEWMHGFGNWWKKEAHYFYDLILTGQSTEKFWETIISTN